MHQKRISSEDQLFLSNLAYMRLMVEEGMMDASELPSLCEACSELGIARPTIFGECYCERCWNNQWWVPFDDPDPNYDVVSLDPLGHRKFSGVF